MRTGITVDVTANDRQHRSGASKTAVWRWQARFMTEGRQRRCRNTSQGLTWARGRRFKDASQYGNNRVMLGPTVIPSPHQGS
jgi:hypothetical protein